MIPLAKMILQAGVQSRDDGIAHLRCGHRRHTLLAQQISGAQTIGQNRVHGLLQPLGLAGLDARHVPGDAAQGAKHQVADDQLGQHQDGAGQGQEARAVIRQMLALARTGISFSRMAVLTPNENYALRVAAALKAHVKERLAPYKYPRSFEWRAEPLPRNDRGKVARKLLK